MKEDVAVMQYLQNTPVEKFCLTPFTQFSFFFALNAQDEVLKRNLKRGSYLYFTYSFFKPNFKRGERRSAINIERNIMKKEIIFRFEREKKYGFTF